MDVPDVAVMVSVMLRLVTVADDAGVTTAALTTVAFDVVAVMLNTPVPLLTLKGRDKLEDVY